MFKFLIGSLIRTSIDLTRTFYRVNRRSGYRSIQDGLNEGYDFGDDYWEEYSNDIIDAQIGKAVNAGQETLLGDDYFRKEAKDYCSESGSSYEPDSFVAALKGGLGDEKFDAINIIIEECSIELLEAHDGAFNFGNFSDLYNSNTVYGSFANAAGRINNLVIARFGGYGTAKHLAYKKDNINSFLANNPLGRSRITPSSPFAARTSAQTFAINRRTANSFLSKYPRGTVRQPTTFNTAATKFRGNP